MYCRAKSLGVDTVTHTPASRRGQILYESPLSRFSLTINRLTLYPRHVLGMLCRRQSRLVQREVFPEASNVETKEGTTIRKFLPWVVVLEWTSWTTGPKCQKEGTNARFGARNCTTSQSQYASYEARRKPACQIGAHDPWTPLTSIGSILTRPKWHLATFNSKPELI